MESRKVQRVGTSTLTISLPKDWVEAQKLAKGDQVFLVREGDVLKVVPPAMAQEREREVPEYVIEADASLQDGMLERVIVGNYVLGRERIAVRSSHRLTGDHLAEIRSAVKRLMGMGIIEETTNRVILQCSLDPAQYPLESLVKRLYNLGTTMLEESLEALETKDRRLAEEAYKREDDADMMYWLIVRLVLSAQQDDGLILKLGMENRLNNAGYRVIAKELEAVADDAAAMAQAVMALIDAKAELPGTLLRSLRDYVNNLKTLYSNALAALLTRDLKLANETIHMRVRLLVKEQELANFTLAKIKDTGAVLHLQTILRGLARTADYAKSIANIAFNRYLERSTPLCHFSKETKD